ncbi:hypothetical protein ACIQAC_26260 [Streptomyces sp. NPDC088387]|uniref:hypothetical protein n=1 Tax=Streptomyces sp. NPDC088387 TaxID=3365859 RepID=UPI0037F2CB69
MRDDQDVRDLLGRAVAHVPLPRGEGDTVFARVAQVRWRRRVAATGVTAAVVAFGVAFGTVGLPAASETGVATPTAQPSLSSVKAAGFAKLLPHDVGKVAELLASPLQIALPRLPEEATDGPYDGNYVIRRGGAVGYVVVTAERSGAWPEGNFGAECKLEETVHDCKFERLPDGAELAVWQTAATSDRLTHRGAEMDARLRTRDGTVLHITQSTGYADTRVPGPLLDSYPLTRPQLRELVQRPELLP